MRCLFLRMLGGVIPLTTGSKKIGVDRMHPDTIRQLEVMGIVDFISRALRLCESFHNKLVIVTVLMQRQNHVR